ncbi:MAG: hypothetical protein AAF363_16845 [Bacteroidota bacterium]
MRKYISTFIIIGLVFASISTQAQVNYKVNPTGKHARLLKKLKKEQEELDKDQIRALKDSLNEVKRQNKIASLRLDSLAKTQKGRLNLERSLSKIDFRKHKKLKKLNKKAEKQDLDFKVLIRKSKPDSSSISELRAFGQEQFQDSRWFDEYNLMENHKDSLKAVRDADMDSIKNEYLSQFEGEEWYEQYALVDNYLDSLKAFQDGNLDSLSETYGQEFLAKGEDLMLAEMGEINPEAVDLDQFHSRLDDMSPSEEWLEGQQAGKNILEKPSKEEIFGTATEDLGIDMSKLGKLEQAQQKLHQLKKKYSSIPNTNDMSTAVKRSSMQEEPFKKRLVFGGNFQLTSTDPITIDLSPTLGYKINKKWIAGIGGTYRQTFGNEDASNFEEDLWSLKAFSSYDLIKSFFGYVEYERAFVRRAQVNGEGASDLRWEGTDVFALGIGRRFKFSKKLSMTAILTYNFLFQSGDGIYTSPINARIGFEYTGK